MPDHENTFVLKASNNMEFVIEAHDTDDMRSWLATIRYCMRSGPSEHGHEYKDYHSDVPDLPPRHISGRGGDRLSSNSNFEICPISGEPLGGEYCICLFGKIIDCIERYLFLNSFGTKKLLNDNIFLSFMFIILYM